MTDENRRRTFLAEDNSGEANGRSKGKIRAKAAKTGCGARKNPDKLAGKTAEDRF